MLENQTFPPAEKFIDLAEAAALLGVHFTTLRRWADAGKVPHIRTPGGRRRFALAELESFAHSLSRGEASLPLPALEAGLSGSSRPRLPQPAADKDRWVTLINNEQRLSFQRSGQRLMGLLMQFVSRTDAGETFLSECRQMGQDYSLTCRQAGMSIGDTIQAFLHFRRSVLATIHETSTLSLPSDPDTQRMFERTSDFMDTFLLEVVEGYSAAR